MSEEQVQSKDNDVVPTELEMLRGKNMREEHVLGKDT